MARLVVLTSHPIPYQVPIWRKLAQREDVDLTVLYQYPGAAGQSGYDPEFGKRIQWDTPLLEGYKFKILKNYSKREPSTFFGLINPGLLMELTRGRYDYIFVHGWNSVSKCAGMVVAVVLKIPILMHGDNCLMCEEYKPRWKRSLKKIILGFLFKFPHAFLYMGKEDKDFYRYYGVPENKLIFMPFATDNEYLLKQKQSINRSVEREKLGLGDSVTLIFSGKLIQRKRPMDILMAYEKVLKDRPGEKIKLIYMGDGELRKDLEDYAASRCLAGVIFTGFKNISEMPAVYSVADIFIISSFSEVWGLVVNEAMCFGLPIISSDSVGSVPDLVKEGENGYIYKCGDSDDLARKICSLLDPEVRLSFGKRSAKIVEGYTADKDALAILSAMGVG